MLFVSCLLNVELMGHCLIFKTHFETLDLISCQPCGFVDFIKVNARVSVSHGVCPCVLSYC